MGYTYKIIKEQNPGRTDKFNSNCQNRRGIPALVPIKHVPMILNDKGTNQRLSAVGAGGGAISFAAICWNSLFGWGRGEAYQSVSVCSLSLSSLSLFLSSLSPFPFNSPPPLSLFSPSLLSLPSLLFLRFLLTLLLSLSPSLFLSSLSPFHFNSPLLFYPLSFFSLPKICSSPPFLPYSLLVVYSSVVHSFYFHSFLRTAFPSFFSDLLADPSLILRTVCPAASLLLTHSMVVIASRNILAGVPEGGASAVMRSEIPAPYPLGRSRSLADVFRSNSRYSESQFAPTVVPIGMPSQPISVCQPYWTYSAYWPYRYHRNFNTYDNQITDSFYWHYPFRLWTSHRHNWYHYDSPYYYRRYHDYYNTFYNTELMAYGNRSKMMENLYQETPITQ